MGNKNADRELLYAALFFEERESDSLNDKHNGCSCGHRRRPQKRIGHRAATTGSGGELIRICALWSYMIHIAYRASLLTTTAAYAQFDSCFFLLYIASILSCFGGSYFFVLEWRVNQTVHMIRTIGGSMGFLRPFIPL